MTHIVADILSLMQYTKSMEEEPERCRPDRCCNCGRANPCFHGCYPRKADRTNPHERTLNPILIQRCYCRGCRKTFSILPECIPRARWYLWEIQEMALALLLGGKSLRATARELAPSRRTLARWYNRFQEQYRLYKDALCNYFVDFARTVGFIDFWQTCLNTITLAKAMRLCHVAGVTVP